MNIIRSSVLCRLSSNVPKFLSTSSVRLNSSEIPKNVIADLSTAQHQQPDGLVYDKKPFKIDLEEGKRYSWCLCGKSKSQPLCDGTHKLVQYKITLKPVRFQVEKTGTYWLCNCKHTKNRPFCDGTHKSEDIQSKAGK
ncbi:CDGSH iron-sulfur domain-containing protein 3, mitochondrial [Culex quinquefasciatus]|uniref:CDGSH iron-sulfur domain-containing protein 3, mitochondrial n=1 Tax=Culex quinquefasciatus TaxID=7176 RepID=UPI0018E3B645|nr:CDGSH iron-sulfur domain-containing protein 3, mitochondrial [Culex quinquefasciatus]